MDVKNSLAFVSNRYLAEPPFVGPGSFLEVSKLLPLLTRGSKDSPAFHLVAPSLPNFGFSSVVRKKGFSIPQYGEACHKLMQELGYTKYGVIICLKISVYLLANVLAVTQGGDWGSQITRVMGALYPDHVLASHLNMILAKQPPKWSSNPLLALQHAFTPYTSREQQGLARTQWFLTKGHGYRTQQSTKPQTLGYALADSPVGLLAWIYEKLHDWADSYPWTDDEILTWVSIYWFSTAGPAASLRIYFEEEQGGIESFTRYNTRAKLGLAYFPRDIIVTPKIWGRALGPVIYESDQDSGGHFATWEKPEAIAKDLRSMFKKGGPVYGVVPGLDGY